MHTTQRFLFAAMLGAAVFGSGACNSDGDELTSSSTITLALTDAASDELASFRVAVTAFRLVKANAAVVSLLSEPIEVDLTALADSSLVLSSKTTGAGTFVRAEVTFDFTNAQAVLVGRGTPATLLDAEGNALTGEITYPIQFEGAGFVAPHLKHRLLELDFDLDQSVVTDVPNNSVALAPTLLMHADPTSPKTLLVVGELTSVDTAASQFHVDLKTLNGNPVGSATVVSGALTVFQNDGVPNLGAAGLTALEAQGAGTWAQILAAIDPNQPRLLAFGVAAGAGTYNGGQDIVEGNVISRSGGAGADATLVVRGHSNSADHTSFQFNTDFNVTTSFANTKVLKFGSFPQFDSDAVNVGQRVRVYGALSGTDLTATAGDAVVRMEPTYAFGLAASAPVGGVLTCDLQRVDLLPQTDFTWTDSGTNPPVPATFSVDVGTLGNGLGIAANTPVAARGHFAPVDAAGPDQEALTLINLATAPALMLVRDLPGTGHTVAVNTDPTQILVGVSGSAAAGELAVIDSGFAGSQTLPAVPTPSIQPDANAGLYFLVDKVMGTNQAFTDFAQFSAALGAATGQGASIFQIGAVGPYDSGANAITASLVSICIQ